MTGVKGLEELEVPGEEPVPEEDFQSAEEADADPRSDNTETP